MNSFWQRPRLLPSPLALAMVLSIGLAGCAEESSDALLDKARQSLAAGDTSAAIIQLKSAIQQDAANAQARLELGKLYLKGGLHEAAEKEFRRAQDAGLDAAQVQTVLARALNGQGAFSRTLEEIAQPNRGGANETELLVARATAQMRLGKKADAEASLAQALAAAPKSPDVHFALAQFALVDRRLEDALEAIDTALKHDPKHVDAWMLKGDLMRASGKNKEALAAYQAALKVDPRLPTARLAVAGIAIDENRLADAHKDVDAVFKVSPNNLQARYTQALLDFREKKVEAAREHLAAVVRGAPDYVPALLLAGKVEFALGNVQTAEAHLLKVVRAAPRNLQARRLLAATQLQQGRTEDAARTLAVVNLEKVKDAGVLAVAAEIASAQRDFSRAASLFAKAAELRPDNAALRAELGLARLAQGDDRALSDLKAAAGMAPGTRVDSILILNQLKQKQFDNALASVALLEQKQPNTPLASNYRGAAYLGKKDITKARESFTEALKRDPGFFPAAANLAQLDLKDGQPTQAQKRFEGVLKANPKHLEAMMALAELSLQRKDKKAHALWLEKAANAHPQALAPRAAMARRFLAEGDKPRALAAAREAVERNPDDIAALDLLGKTQLAADKANDAIATFNILARKAGQSPHAHLRLAEALAANKQRAEARSSVERALRLQPDHLQALDALLRIELAEKKYEAALKAARQMQTQHARSPLGFQREGDILLSQKRLPEAIRAYEQSLAKGAPSSELIKLHRAYVKAGDSEAADKRLADWLRQYPEHYAVRAYAANHYMMGGRSKEAIEQYEAIRRKTPANVVVLNNLANLYQNENDSRALAVAEEALKLAPGNAAVLDTVGWILVQQNQTRRGLDVLRKAVSSAPSHATIRYHHAVALAHVGEKAQARKELEKLLTDAPEFPSAKEARAMLGSL
jgi:putative PEP-CTERM system TPR-repeat lipoprotein